MSGGRCVACGLLVEIFPRPADEAKWLSIMRDLQVIGRKRGFMVQRGDRDYTYCVDCVGELIAKSQGKL